MPIDFTVIQAVRQRFGDQAREDLEELEAPFVGASKSFPFACPNVDAGTMAVLQFESLGVSLGQAASPRNILRINGVDIPGGITPGPFRIAGNTAFPRFPTWKTHSLLVPANVLREQNVLFIASITGQFGPGTHLDNFMIDNIVVLFKTRRSPVGGGTADPSPRVTANRSKTTPRAGSKKKPRARRGLKQARR